MGGLNLRSAPNYPPLKYRSPLKISNWTRPACLNSHDICFRRTYRIRLTWRWCNTIIHPGSNIWVISLSYLMQRIGMQSRYSQALTATPEDVELLTNEGDCCIQLAEIMLTGYQQSERPIPLHQAWPQVKEIYEKGLQVYSKACANADTRIGDDLGGLLQNWSAGLLSFAEVIRCHISRIFFFLIFLRFNQSIHWPLCKFEDEKFYIKMLKLHNNIGIF